MRIPTSRDRQDLSDGNTMTPMIDVVFLLLIFFVCASIGDIKESIMPTKLSGGTVAAKEPLDTDPWVTEIWVALKTADDGRTLALVNKRPFADYQKLEQQLKALAEVTPDSPVILDVAQSVPWGDVILAYDACDRADFDSIQFATDPKRAAGMSP